MAQPETILYAAHPTRKGDRELFADIYLPETAQPADLLTWMHSGGFRTGSRSHRNHARIAAEFNKHGYAVAFIDYRLARPPAILQRASQTLLPKLALNATEAGEEMHVTFYGSRPLGVVEDCCAFLQLANREAKRFNLSGRMLLGGSSAGAISALNVLYLARHLDLERPDIATVFAFSGGFAYPGYLWETGARILAQHSELDERVPISSIRRLAATTKDPMLLIEHDEHRHGSIALDGSESTAEAVDRCVQFDRADDPMSIPISVAGFTTAEEC